MKYLNKYNTLADWEGSTILDIPNVSYIVEDDMVKYSKTAKESYNIFL
jgi:hypothetical protein